MTTTAFPNKLGWKALGKWRDLNWNANTMEAQRRCQLVTQAMQRMRLRSLSIVYIGWRSRYTEVVDTKRILKGMLHYFGNRLLVMSFGRWREWQIDMRAQADLLKTVVLKMRNRQVSFERISSTSRPHLTLSLTSGHTGI